MSGGQCIASIFPESFLREDRDIDQSLCRRLGEHNRKCENGGTSHPSGGTPLGGVSGTSSVLMGKGGEIEVGSAVECYTVQASAIGKQGCDVS
jgi:hypothetical protein